MRGADQLCKDREEEGGGGNIRHDLCDPSDDEADEESNDWSRQSSQREQLLTYPGTQT